MSAAMTVVVGLAVLVQAPTSGQQQQRQQEQQQQQPPPPTFRTEANFVRVDVFPTANGRSVGDLKVGDFELFEDGVSQRIETFEYIMVRAAGSQSERAEPNTVAQANAMAADPRNRVFILFLDTNHVAVDSSHRIRRPLVRLLDRIIGQDDLVAVMTPEMSARDIALGRRTTTIEGMLARHWDWGERHRITYIDPTEQKYIQCYPDLQGTGLSGIAREMIDRRREKRTLDALEDLIIHLRGLKEERKAILTISEGWRLFRPNPALAKKLENRGVTGLPRIGVGPDGKIAIGGDDARRGTDIYYQCDVDRLHLSQIDNEYQFRQMLDEANRSNASFYPVDPRGLPAFDTPIGPDPPLHPAADHEQLRNRITTLQTLAGATDGIAVVNSNDIESGLRRVVSDLTAYYLLGYYTTNTKLDGRFRSIKVRVKRPGVDVRARRGYRAATKAEVTAGSVVASPVVPAEIPGLEAALSSLADTRSDLPLRLHIVAEWLGAPTATPGSASRAMQGVWVVGELDYAVARKEEWRGGGEGEITVGSERGRSLASAKVQLAPGVRNFLVHVPLASTADSEYIVRVRVRPVSSAALPLSDVARFSSPDAGEPTSLATGPPLLFRRGPSTRAEYLPTADFRFRRNERIRFEAPAPMRVSAGSARVLDRAGHPLDLPLSVGTVPEASERSGWLTGELSLAPLAVGDYVLAIRSSEGPKSHQVLLAFRVVP